MNPPRRQTHLVHTGLCLLLVLGGLLPALAWDSERMQSAAVAAGARAQAAVARLQPLLTDLRAATDPQRLQAINQFFNRQIAYAEDIDVWGQVDYWTSPLETLQKGEGDCEDYAIAKYLSLVATGVPVARLRLVYVRAEGLGRAGASRAHMVLAYHGDATTEPLILDNLIEEIRPASRRPDLTPVFSFNSEGLWQGAANTPAGDPLRRLSRWREVLEKARREGFL